jgi:hypothetical protein
LQTCIPFAPPDLRAGLAWILQPSGEQAKEDVMKNWTGALGATSALSLAFLAGCASNEPVASPQLTAVRQAIDQAQQADAQHYATREINTARNKLEAAEDAHEKGEEARASDLAEQAKLDAEYAAAVAQNQEAQNAVKALNETLDTLRNELSTKGTTSGSSDAGAPSPQPLGSEPSAPPAEQPLQSEPQSPSAQPPSTGADSLGDSTNAAGSGSGVEGR